MTFIRYYVFSVIYWLVLVFVWLSIGNAFLVGYGFHNESARFVSLFPTIILQPRGKKQADCWIRQSILW